MNDVFAGLYDGSYERRLANAFWDEKLVLVVHYIFDVVVGNNY